MHEFNNYILKRVTNRSSSLYHTKWICERIKTRPIAQPCIYWIAEKPLTTEQLVIEYAYYDMVHRLTTLSSRAVVSASGIAGFAIMTLALFKSVSIAWTHAAKLYRNTYRSIITHSRYQCQLLDPKIGLYMKTYTIWPLLRTQPLPSHFCTLSVLGHILSIEQGMPYAWSLSALNWGSHDRHSSSQESNSSEVELHGCEDLVGSGLERCSIKRRELEIWQLVGNRLKSCWWIDEGERVMGDPEEFI